MSCTDVCIVGGGPAGLASAIALRLKGFSVSLFEAALPPIDKACGEGLLPDSVRALHELGIKVSADLGFAFTGIAIRDDYSSVCSDFKSGVGFGIRRTVLHKMLTSRAADLGVQLCWGVKRVGLTGDSLVVGTNIMKPKLIVAADGLNSRLRRSAGLHRVAHEAKRYAFRQHFGVRPWSPRVEIRCGPGFQIYVTPVSDDEVSGACISANPKLRVGAALAAIPELAGRLLAGSSSSQERGALTISRTFNKVCRPGFALVGDASGSVDAITGEGIGLGFRQAFALSRAFSENRLQDYERMHRRLSLRPRVMSAVLLRAGSCPKLQARVLRCLSQNPDLFQRLLAVHVGDSSFGSLASPSLITAGISLLRT